MTEAEQALHKTLEEVIHWFQYPIAVQKTNEQLMRGLQTAKTKWVNEMALRELRRAQNGSDTRIES